MKRSNIAVLVFSIGAVSVANAADFAGVGLAVDMQFKSTTGQSDYIGRSNNEVFRQKISLGGEHDVIGGLNLNFGFAVAPRVVLQVGATADIGKTDIYKATQATSSASGLVSASATLKEKNHYSIYFAPGHLLTPKTMLYAKLAYHHMKLDWSAVSSSASGIQQEAFGNSFKGFGLGTGFQAMVTDNLYVYAEVQYGQESLNVTATEKMMAKLGSTIGALGIG